MFNGLNYLNTIRSMLQICYYMTCCFSFGFRLTLTVKDSWGVNMCGSRKWH